MGSLNQQEQRYIRANATRPEGTGEGGIVGEVTQDDLAKPSVGTEELFDNAVTNAKAADMAGNTAKVNDQATVGDPTDLLLPEDTVLGRLAGENLKPIPLVDLPGGLPPDDSITNAKLAPMPANSAKVNATASTANPQDLTAGADTILGRDGASNLAFFPISSLPGGLPPPDSVTNAMLAPMPANTVKVNATGGVANPQDLAVATNTVLGRQGANVVAAQVATGQVADDAITNAKLAPMSSVTIKANPAVGPAQNPSDVTLGADTLLANVGGVSLQSTRVYTDLVEDGAISLLKMADLAANDVYGNDSGGIGPPSAINLTTETVLGRGATGQVRAVAWSEIGTGGLPPSNSVTNDMLVHVIGPAMKVQPDFNGGIAKAYEDLAIGVNQVAARIGAGSIIGTQIIGDLIQNNSIQNNKLGQMLSITVKSNPTAGVADAQDFQAPASGAGGGTVLGKRTADTTLDWIPFSELGGGGSAGDRLTSAVGALSEFVLTDDSTDQLLAGSLGVMNLQATDRRVNIDGDASALSDALGLGALSVTAVAAATDIQGSRAISALLTVSRASQLNDLSTAVFGGIDGSNAYGGVTCGGRFQTGGIGVDGKSIALIGEPDHTAPQQTQQDQKVGVKSHKGSVFVTESYVLITGEAIPTGVVGLPGDLSVQTPTTWNPQTAVGGEFYASGLAEFGSNVRVFGQMHSNDILGGIIVSSNDLVATGFQRTLGAGTGPLPQAVNDDVVLPNASWVKLEPWSDVDSWITGIDGGTDGKHLWIANLGPSGSIWIVDESDVSLGLNSQPENRILIGNPGVATRIELKPDDTMQLIYDDDQGLGAQRWRVVA